MKLVYRVKISAYTIVVFLILAGCKKFVQIGAPSTQLVTSSVFNNNASATSAQTVIYSQMFSNEESFFMALNTGMLSDELTNYNNSVSFEQYYSNAMTSLQSPIAGPWINAYNYIYQANAILAALQNNNALSPAIVQQLTGESMFVRAFWLFYLTNLYGDVPLVTNTDYTKNAIIARTPQTQVYQQIISDLKNAQQLLNVNYVDISDTTVTTERTRPTKWAATALLARVYLYTGDYSDAIAQATAVINNNSLYKLCPNVSSVFLANSTEAIWQLATTTPASYNTYDGLFFILIAAPGNSNSCCTVSNKLLSSFENGDTRRLNWIDSFKTVTTSYHYTYKYKIGSSAPIAGSSTNEYTMVLRLAEQYLIRAEAYADQNNAGAAIGDLNVIRERAKLQDYAGSSDKDSVLKAILHERQVELFTEWGHRWLDLIRTGSADSVMSVYAPTKGSTWSSDGHQELFPIPQSERNADAALTQNSGY
jgi:tetratricopeptide (TPR) repeat protein